MTQKNVLDPKYCTAKNVIRDKPLLVKHSKDKFETLLFLPEGEGRQGEGGLRTQGYFKSSIEDKPLITVITVVYNGEQFLEDTILSVINQTYDNVEYIIIDGGSSDGTLNLIHKYEHAIDYWVSEKDNGIYDAMNKGVSLVTGDLVNFMNSDDIFDDFNVLMRLSSEFNQKEVVLFYGDVKYSNGKRFLSALSAKTLLHNTIHHQGAFYRKELFRLFRYDGSLNISSDYELNLIIYLQKQFTKSLGFTVSMCRDGGVSRTFLKKAFLETNIIRKRNVNFIYNILLTSLYTIKFLISLVK